MDRSSPSRVAGCVVREVSVGGKTYTLSSPIRVGTAAQEESLVIARRLDMLGPMMSSCASLPPEAQQMAMAAYTKAMVVGIASDAEWDAYYNSLWKLAFDFWTSLDDKEKFDPADKLGQRRRTLLDGVRWCYEIINSPDVTGEEAQSLRLAIRIVSQKDQLGNSSGPNSPQDTPKTDARSTVGT